jgi:hypothetical protein
MLSQVLAQYLVYVCLFTRNLGYKTSEYLFVNKQGLWAGAELTTRLAEATALHLGVRLLVSEWRHVAIAVGDCFLHKGIQAFWDSGVSGAGAGDKEELAAKEKDKEKNKKKKIITITKI